jgi:5-methylcytosine-specific restriction endonuclease McrA
LVNNKKKWHTAEEYAAAKKKSQKKYNKSPKGITNRIKAHKNYQKKNPDKVRATARRHYWKYRDEIIEKNRGNPVRLESQSKYNKSDKGKASHARYRKTHDPIIDTEEYMIRRACRKRDNHTCQWDGCNETEHLHAHHIFKRSDYSEFKYDLWNLITYCPFHHFWTHIMNGEIKDAIFVTAYMDISF